MHCSTTRRARSAGQLIGRGGLLFALMSCTALTPLHSVAADEALPTGGRFTAGAGRIVEQPGGLRIEQGSRTGIVEWQGFSIGNGQSVHVENGAGATLNRVTGNLPSRIDGSLTATGSVYLVNRAGIVVGKEGRVDTGGGFFASTHDVSDAAFAAQRDLTFAGESKAAVVNLGTITSRGGDVALIARSVRNEGKVSAPKGTVALLAGYEVLAKETADGEGRFAVKVGGSDTEAVNAGTLAAANAEMRANGGTVYALAGNTGGVVKATGVAKRDGRVFLTAGDGGSVTVESPVVAQRRTGEEVPKQEAARKEAGHKESAAKHPPRPSRRPDRSGGDIRVSGRSVTVSGRLDASGTTGAGGTLVATGGTVVLSGTAALDVTGASGGTLLVGGDYQGGRTPATRYLAEPVATARTVTVEAGAQLRADGTRGDGGRVVLWSDGDTAFAGAISARGAAKGGDAEVSGKARLAFTGTADLRGPAGFGTLLLDPYNLTISDAADSGMSGFSASGNDSVLNVNTLQSAVTRANVLVTTGDGGTQAGDITVAAPFRVSSYALTLAASRDIIVNAAIDLNASTTMRLKADRDVVVNAAVTGGSNSSIALLAKRDVAVNAAIGGAKVVLWSDYGGSGTGGVRFGTGATVTASGGLSIFYNPTSYATPTDYSGIAGAGTAVTGYMLVNTAENLQAIGTNLAGAYALGRDIDAQATAGWNSGAGFAPLGSAATPFTGLFDGRDRAINGLTINRTDSDDVGLFGVVGTSGVVRDVRMVGGSVLGRNRVGALVGSNAGAVNLASATGTVTGWGGEVGGLVGSNSGTVGQSFATGAVTAQGGAAGGLIGDNAGGTVNQAYASGAVTAQGDKAGGLVGRTTGGNIAQAYALGDVTGALQVGGLVGDNNGGTVTETYATGAVTGQAEAGGLVGANSGTVTLSFWDTQTTGRSNAAGSGVDTGMTGLTTDNARTLSPGGGASAYQGWSIGVTGQSWFMNAEASTLPDLRPIGAWEEARVGVEGYAVVTNLHQLVLINNRSPIDSRPNYLRDYWLATDIDASATRGTNPSDIWGPRGFLPLGYRNNAGSFGGTFDGNGHVVKGVYINRESRYKGFFGIISILTQKHSNVVVKNFGVVDGTVIGGSADIIGGMVGQIEVAGDIENSYFTGSVSGREVVGGLVGLLLEGNIRKSYAIASVTGSPTATTGSIGGLVGIGNYANIEQSYASGLVTGPAQTGGFVGTAEELTITSSYWDKDTSGQQNGIGNATLAGLTGLTTVEARQSSSYVGWDFTKDWYQSGDMRPLGRWEAAKAASDGIAAITNLHQLQLIDANPTGSYRLGADIDAQATSGADAAGIWGPGGFTPLAGTGAGFTGGFDGRGHLIRGLTINRPASDDVGLFGKIGTGGTVSNVGLDATGAITGGNRVGAIAGTNGGTILQSFSGAGVTGQGAGTGGLAGSNSGTIRQSYAAGAVAGQGDGVGGLAGVNDGTILQTYATGAVTGQGDRVGGLAGTNGTGGSIAQSYATGAVAGQGAALGGLAGVNDGTVTLSYWNTEASGRADGVGAGTPTGMTGLTGTQMRDANSFTGLDVLAWAPADGTDALLLFGVSGVVGIVHDTVYGDDPATVPIAVLGGSVWNRISGGATSTLAVGANVGTYLNLVDASGVTGSFGLGGAARVVNVGAVVTPATLTLTASGGTMVYGDTVPALTDYSVTGWKNGQTDALLSGVTVSTDATSLSNVGTDYRTMTAGGTLSGAANGNYTLSHVDGAFSVTPATLTVTAAGGTMVYGDTVPALTDYSVTGWRNGQDDALLSGITVSTDATSVSSVATSYRTTTAGGTLSGAASGNYTFARVDGAFSVTPATLTVTAAGGTMVYGDTVPALTDYSVTGWKNGQTDALLTGVTVSTDATSLSNVGTSYRTMTAGGTLSGAAAGNYTFNRTDGAFSVTPATLTVTASDSTMVYGDAVPTLGYSLSGWKNGQTDALLSGVTVSTDATSVSNVGTSYRTTAVGGTLSGAAAGNYTLSHVGGAFSVTPATLTVTAAGGTMVYGDTVPALTDYSVTGWKNGQDDALLSGITVSTDATSVSNVGTAYRTMTAGGTLSGAAVGNYTFARVDGAFSVTPATLTVTAAGGTMVYGDAVPALTDYSVTGWKNGQDDALLSGITVSTDATSVSNVGAAYRTMTAGGTLSGAAAGNYTLSHVGGVFSVTPATLTVTAAGGTMVYGDTVPALTDYSVTGWKNGQTDGLLSGVTVFTDATSQSNVGTSYRTMTAGGALSGAATGNYSFDRVDGDFSVTPATLTVTAANSTMVYGDAVPVLGYTASGWKNGQGDGLLSDVTASTDATSLSNVGTSYRTTTAGGTLSGAAAGNYTLNHVGGSFSVTPATLTVTAGSRKMVYGDALPGLDYSVAGWKNGQTDRLLSGVGVSTDATAQSNVGDYRIATTGGALSGAAAGNYTLHHVDGSLSVTPATLTVTAADGTMVYGDAVPVLGYSVSGWKNGQGDGLLSGVAVSSDATAHSNVGTGYRTMTTGGTLSGAAAGNYSFNRVDGRFSVTPAILTVTAADGTMVYGDAVPALGYSLSGWKNGQSDGLLSGVAVSTDATSLSNVGTGYRTTAAGGTLSGAAAGNYRLSHVGGAFSVTPALLTVTASDGSMIYGDAVPALGYSVTGWKNGQTDAMLSGVTLSTDAGPRSAAGGGYRTMAAGGTLSGLAAGNYVIRHADGRLTIGRRPLTVVADNAARLAGVPNPPLTYRVVGPGPLDGDRIDGLPETLATAASPAGTYAITRGGLTAGDNYDLRFTPGLLTVSPQPSGLAAILPARLIEPETLSGPAIATLGRPAEAGGSSGSASPAAVSEVDGPEITGNRKDGAEDVCGAVAGEGCASLPHPANRFIGTFLSVKSP